MVFLMISSLENPLSFLLFLDFSLAADLIIMEGVSLATVAGLVGNEIRIHPAFLFLFRTVIREIDVNSITRTNFFNSYQLTAALASGLFQIWRFTNHRVSRWT